MATLASALVFAGTAVPAAAGAQPVSEPAVTGDAPDVVAGHATAAPAVKLDRPVTAGKSDCSPEALDAKTAVPLGAEAGPGLQGLKGITCTAERTTGGSPPGARDAALAKLRAGESAPASTLSKRLVGVRGGQEPNAADYIQPPQFCFDHAFDGWWGTRTEMCQITWGLINLYVVDSSGVRTLVGQAEWLEYDFAYTTDIIDTWAHQIRTTKYWSTGVGNTPATINGYAWCGGDCKQNSDTGLRPTSFVTDTNNDGEAYYDSTRGERGGIGYSQGHWEYWITYPGFPPSNPLDVTLPDVRCDNAIGDNTNNLGDPEPASAAVIGAGCVFLGILPVMVYSKTGFYPTLAAHIEAAQNSGLPGAYPAGAVLNRVADPVKKSQNGNRACPRNANWPRPSGKQCDEYPPRSTTQGAFTQTPQGTARTFAPPNVPWCEMSTASGVPTGVTGPTGWSSCMIVGRDNYAGGAALGAFYSSKRVLDGDAFKVWIQP